MGIGMGIKISTIPIYSAEVSPASIRGGIVTSFQFFVAFGILVGFSCNLAFMNIGPLAWRFQLAAAFVPAVPLMVLIWFTPESPRWLMKKGRYQKAFRAFNRIRNTELISARELFYAHCQIMSEVEVFGGKSLGARALELFTVPRIRRATVSSSIIVIAQQFSGINIMAFYSSTIFAEAGYDTKQALLASFGFVSLQHSMRPALQYSHTDYFTRAWSPFSSHSLQFTPWTHSADVDCCSPLSRKWPGACLPADFAFSCPKRVLRECH